MEIPPVTPHLLADVYESLKSPSDFTIDTVSKRVLGQLLKSVKKQLLRQIVAQLDAAEIAQKRDQRQFSSFYYIMETEPGITWKNGDSGDCDRRTAQAQTWLPMNVTLLLKIDCGDKQRARRVEQFWNDHYRLWGMKHAVGGKDIVDVRRFFSDVEDVSQRQTDWIAGVKRVTDELLSEQRAFEAGVAFTYVLNDEKSVPPTIQEIKRVDTQQEETKRLERENAKLNRKLERAEEENKTQAQELHQTNKELDQAQKRQRKEDKALESALNASGKFFDKESKLREKYSQEARLNMIQRSLSKELQKYVLGDTGYVNISAFVSTYVHSRGRYLIKLVQEYVGEGEAQAKIKKLIYRLNEFPETTQKEFKKYSNKYRFQHKSLVAKIADFAEIDAIITHEHRSSSIGEMCAKEKQVKHYYAF